MPQTKKKEEKKIVKESKGNDEIVINLDTLAIPAAIVVAGLIIAGAIFFTNKGKDNPIDTNTNTNTNTDTTDTAKDEFAAATTTIGDSPYLGNIKKAKVAIVEYTDFQCPYCARHSSETEPSIIKDYVDTGKIIYVVRSFPLDFHGQIAIDSANAALCVNEIAGNSKYFEFYKQIFEKASTDELAAVAQGLGVNMAKYNTCMTENRYKAQIDKDMADGSKAGVQGTPGFVIGVLDKNGNVEGKLIAGAYPYASFKTVIDEMLAK